MKTTYSFPLLCALDHENKITNFCALDGGEFNNKSNLVVKIANRLNLSKSYLRILPGSWSDEFIKLTELDSSLFLGPITMERSMFDELNANNHFLFRVIFDQQYLIENNIERKGKCIEMVREYLEIENIVGIGSTMPNSDIAVQYLIEEIETYADPNSYIIVPKDVEITGVPQVTGSFDKDTNTFSPAENLHIIPTNEWADSHSITASITKPKPDETYIFDFEENEWFPDPELDYDLHDDGKPYRYNPENKLWYPNWEPEPEPDS
jgi:hypothetical protein